MLLKIIAYPLTVIYLLVFGLTLVVFHPIQWACHKGFGYKAHKKSVDILNLCLMRCMHVLGVRYSFINEFKIESGHPMIIVANHQSMNDIPPIIWHMRRFHPKFISKQELGKGIPSVSYNLRHGGSVLINRKDPVRSIKAIEQFASQVNSNNWAAVIFPEGTRSRDGVPKTFKRKGLETLMSHMPNATIVPLSISNSWKTLRYGKFPMGIGAHIKLKVHQPIAFDGQNIHELIDQIEHQITQYVTENQ
ncbi:MAG: 1-acyl-sn-glycerol-3-phosphate acyltransferase [Flavobacteriaceae bacterium]|nr:1-acyl-sn-glycerol-3-phosphate acyltransferase [Bacteroidia bacterium]MBT8288322.1 1-acyl-sn-glycerol-3-phosphate acyltransferase [Bacteroidia bacterium]NNF75102.1 1-acyl-sn-glycerol-3-phosphate acyltransferase [Flavobacteriaceae bacterium]NNK73818.1 1-acyl-sn-glycerol-3-phosphate acyltransferase [Flavobacteriaceae bacterium]